MNNKLLIVCVLSLMMLFISPMALAASDQNTQIASIGEIEQYTAISLPQGGSNGTDSWDNCNITSIINPEKTIILGMVEMTKIDMVFNYTLDAYNTSKLGTYIVNSMCYDGVNMIPGSYTFEVTTTGSTDNTKTILLVIGMALIMIIFAFAFDSEWFAWPSGALFLISGLYVILNGFGSTQNLYSDGVGWVCLGLGLTVLFASAFHYTGGLASAFGVEGKEHDEYDYFNK